MKDKIATKIREIAEQMQQELNSNHNKQTKCENLVFMQGQIGYTGTAVVSGKTLKVAYGADKDKFYCLTA